MPKQSTQKKPGRPKGSSTKGGKNASGGGRPPKYDDRNILRVAVEADVKRAFDEISPERGDLTRHLQAALNDYLQRKDIRAKREEIAALLAAGDTA